MKLLFTIGLSLLGFVLQAQVSMIARYTNSTVLTRNQLWELTVTNAQTTPITCRVNVVVTDALNGNTLLNAASGLLPVQAGTNDFSVTNFGAIVYTPMVAALQSMVTQNALFPAGSYNICYSFIDLGSEATMFLEACETLDVEALGQLELLLPQYDAKEEAVSPLFMWQSALMEINNPDIRYELTLVELLPGQDENNAIQFNQKLVFEQNLLQSPYQMPAQSNPLVVGKYYAWRVVAKNGLTIVSISDVWKFKLVALGQGTKMQYEQYNRLSQQDALYKLNSSVLRLEYFNESADTSVSIKLLDISGGEQRLIVQDTVRLSTGRNLLVLELERKYNMALEAGKLYQVLLTDGRGLLWRLRLSF
jgi:hypothetical protein